MIFFDAAGTLFTLNEPVGDIYSRFAAKHGYKIAPKILTANFRQFFPFQPPLAFAPEFSVTARLEAEKNWWLQLVKQVFAEPQNFPMFTDFFEEVFDWFAQRDAWQLAPDVIPTLQELQRREIRLGIISNFDSRLRRILDEFALAQFFSTIHISSEVGTAKPDAKIFQSALTKNSLSAHEALHVGDSWKEDILGAQGVGLSACWIGSHQVNETLPVAVHKIECLSDLLTQL